MERLTRRHADGELFRPLYIIDGRKEYVNETDILEKLAEYEDLEEQGRLLKLPCEIGHKVYVIYQFCGEGAWEIEEHKIRLEDLDKIGKTVFLTREKAESALKELKGEN